MNKLLIILTAITFMMSSCEKEVKKARPNRCKITKVTISSISERNWKGAKWDSLDAPDIYMLMWGHGYGDYFNDSINRLENNTTYPINYMLKKPFQCVEINWIGVMEYDRPWNDENLIAAWEFRPSSFPDRPKIITLKNGETSIILEITW